MEPLNSHELLLGHRWISGGITIIIPLVLFVSLVKSSESQQKLHKFFYFIHRVKEEGVGRQTSVLRIANAYFSSVATGGQF